MPAPLRPAFNTVLAGTDRRGRFVFVEEHRIRSVGFGQQRDTTRSRVPGPDAPLYDRTGSHIFAIRPTAMIRSFFLLFATAFTLHLNAQRVVPFGTGAAAPVTDMATWNGQLVVTGVNTMALLGVSGTGVQSWVGNQVFSFPTVFATGTWRQVEELNGELYVGGRILPQNNVARWDGSSWVGLDQGLPETVTSLCVHQGALHAATRDGLVCRWTGAVWDTLGGRFDDDVFALVSHQNVLYAAGDFEADAAQTPMAYVAHWNGNAWQQVGAGLASQATDLLSTPDGLVIGGYFTADGAGNPLPQRWAVWNGSTFSVPALSPMPKHNPSTFDHRLAVLPDGSYLVGGFRVSGNTAFDLNYVASSAAAFDGHWFLGAVVEEAYTGFTSTNPFSELIDGVHHTVVDAGAMRATVTPTPALFERHWMDLQGLEVPQGGGVHSVYSASPLLMAKQQGVWKRSLPRYNSVNNDSLLWAGPQQALVRDEAYYRRYHQVWTLDQYTIDQHAAHWNDPGYETPYVIATWPGNGNTANGEPARLAPFQDQDNDGLYEPEAGDHPLIRGDRAAYTILHSDTYYLNDLDLKCDMHLMVYNYVEPSFADRYNSTFINLRMINRSGAAYDSVRVGMFTDLDVGGFNDDLTECDSTRNLWYAYNGDELDADTVQQGNVILGYGAQPPAIGFKFLNQLMTSHSAWQSSDENVTFTELMELLNGTPGGVPHVGPGYSSRFQFPGGTWSDTFVASDSLADRRSLGGAGPFTWAADDTLCVDLAVIHARATTGGAYASVAALKQRADGVQAWYENAEFSCNAITNVVRVAETATVAWRAYPIPTEGLLILSGAPPANDLRINVLDAMGRLVLSRTWPAGRSTLQLDLSAVEEGTYLVLVSGADGRHALRVIKAE